MGGEVKVQISAPMQLLEGTWQEREIHAILLPSSEVKEIKMKILNTNSFEIITSSSKANSKNNII